ncbi:MAG: hypothetical protein Greene041679_234 [Parcubacteria group bacterium Greene0416_79]|nr:MAG: hypothetical protein Greene041679_234 [Parcubacteria group bacterium Greene0416_79]
METPASAPQRKPLKRVFGVERNVFFMGLVSFFNDFSAEMIVSIFPAFFSSVLKAGAASLGLIEGVAEGFANFIKIFSGRLSDAVARRKIFAVFGYALSVATRPLYLFAAAPAHVFGIRVADRVGKGLRDAPRDALISLSAPREELGRSFGFHRAMDSFGAILGPLAAFFILRAFPGGFDAIFIVSFMVGVCAVLSFVFVHEVAGIVRNPETVRLIRSYPKKLKWLLYTMALLSVGNIPVAVLLLRTQESGLNISFIPLFYLFFNVSFTLFSSFAGRAADRVGERRVISYGYALLCIGYLFIMYDGTLAVLAVGFFLLGAALSLVDGVQRAYIGKLTGAEMRGSAYGLFNAALGVGTMIAGALGGFIWQRYSSTAALVTAVIIVLIGLMAFMRTAQSGTTVPR